MTSVAISANHRAVRDYYAKRDELAAQKVTNELAVREAFKGLLEAVAGVNHWTLVMEQKVEGLTQRVVPDGTLRDVNTYPRGYWEAKDTHDDLDAEIQKKFERGYPRKNIIFEDTRRAVLFQSGERAGDYDLSQPEHVAALLTRFLSYTDPNIEGFEQAVERFKQDTPELARGLLGLIEEAHLHNAKFQAAFSDFYKLCKNALNPNIRREAVDEMLIQHLLTERLMRTVFDNPDFAQRNAIAVEAEAAQMQMFAQKNSERVERQKQAPITVIIGNPPYNANQQNENDNNKNRKYKVIDKLVSETYARDSRATNRDALSDPYVKFFRWHPIDWRGATGLCAS
jgi:hypothetical protein